ncbi:uncharacterized protein BDW43DRAFT_277293 [Aspergillus alliaceus]|uniref:uncharacterized protein n=1 Tax=Petromyces alliaceus TaxID=209559 RepID=UPI0012A3E800|nr:uncharacterized protein BDW43DRAFT_277293 [Aspergillus alliaceus]KAB8233086.1 hypothetical protein BDW43DRAFT_277293 [Aspergillus alliaceus]
MLGSRKLGTLIHFQICLSPTAMCSTAFTAIQFSLLLTFAIHLSDNSKELLTFLASIISSRISEAHHLTPYVAWQSITLKLLTNYPTRFNG